MTTLRTTIRNRRIEVPAPRELPDGTEVILTIAETPSHEDQPLPPEEIARILAAMQKLEPLEIPAEVAADLDAWERRINQRGIDRNDRLTVRSRKPVGGAFARVRRDEAGRVTITALSEQPPLEVIEREDSFFDREWVLEKDASFYVELRAIKHPKPETLAHVEGAERGVFRLGERYFEIIVY